MLLPGDGIGPEVVAEGRRVLEAVARAHGHAVAFEEQPIGGGSIDRHGTALTDEALAACQACDAVLLGAVGAPKYDDPTSKVRPEQGLLALRKGLGVFANLRPVKVHPALVDASPLKAEKLEGVDLLVLRELTGGLYFGRKTREELPGGHVKVTDAMEYHDYEIRRILELAFRLARGRRGKVTSVDKANVLDTSRLWRQIAVEVGAANPDIALDHMLVDTAAMQLVANPARFDVVVTENMFGDILTDEAAVLAGSMGMLPSRRWATAAPASTNRSTARRRTSPARASPTRPARSSPSHCCCGIRSSWNVKPRRSSRPWIERSPTAAGRAIWAGGSRPRR